MKSSTSNLFCYFCYCTTLVSGLASSASGSSYPSYDAAKTDFEARGLIQRYNLDKAKKWFSSKGYGKDFENYFEAEQFLKDKGYFTRADNAKFALEGEDVDENAYHDVMACLYLSDFVYRVANLRKDTKKYAFKKKELKEEVLNGKSFVSEKDEHAMAQLLTGNLKVSDNPNELSHHVNMGHFEDVLRSKDIYEFSHTTFATLLTATGMNSFKAEDLYIYKFDAKYNNKNLVYSIAGRKKGKRETDLFLAFRGSSTARDWVANLNAPLEEIELRHDKKSGKCYMVEQQTFQKIEIEKDLYDEFKKITEEGPPIKIHTGFLKYLFADRGQESEVDHNEDNDSMYTNIRLNIGRLMRQKGTVNNQLYVTGHSLGGALATIAAFFLASDKTINNNSPNWRGVKCISYASPQVGNVSFQKAFQVLMSKEQCQSRTAKPSQEGRLFSNIRFTNNRDPVPLAVFPSAYRHVGGVNVHLNRPSILSLGRPRKPSIQLQGPEPQIKLWEIFCHLRKPWKIFPQASMMRGLFANSRHLWGLVLTVIPAVLILPFLFLKNLLPESGGFGPLLSLIVESKIYMDFVGLFPQAVTAAIGTIVKTPWFKFGVPAALLLKSLTKPNTGLTDRIGMSAALLIPLTYLFRQHEHAAICLLLAAQVFALIFRGPAEVLTGKVHFLKDYYNHLRPHHQMVSSSAAIYKKAGI